jgi:cytochrome P450
MPERGAAAAADLARGFSLAEPPPGYIDDPSALWAALREHSPLHPIGPNAVLVTRYDDVLAIYRSPQVSSDKTKEFGPKFGVGTALYQHHTTSLVFSDPPLHTRVRRILMGALNQRAIARMEGGVLAMVDALLDRLAALPAPDLIEHYAAQIPVEVIGNLLDVPRGERGPLRAWSLATLSALEPAPSAAVLERGQAAVSEFLRYLKDLMARRAARPGDPELDVLTRLMQGDAHGSLSETELLHNCIFLLNAGHETTTNLIGNGAWLLTTHRDQLERLQADPVLINPAVEELLRYESPIQLNNRLTTAPLALPSGELPADTFVTLAIGSANRDPAEFADPDRLDIARKPNNHLAFGQGAHACSGMNVARMEARIALGSLVARYPKLTLDGTPERDRRLRFRGFRKLPVRLH